MKLWSLATFLSVSILTFSGCVNSTPTPSDSAVVDSSLPVVTLTQNGVFTDMTAVGFEWNSIVDQRVKGVYVYKQTLGDETTEPAYTDTVKSRFVTHYVDKDVKPETQYSYFFKTFSKESESEPSKAVSVSTLPILDSVSWIHVVKDMPRSAKIIWRPHTNQIVKSYILERKTLVDDKWSELATIDGRLNAEFIDNELKDDFVYKYRIKVVTYNNITSHPSKEVSIITKALPKQIANITATTDLPKKIKLTWGKTEIVDFLTYNVYKSDEIDGNYDLITSTQETEFIDILEEDGKNYFYRVSVVDKDELESKSDVKSVLGKSLVKPITPSLVEVNFINDTLKITWKSSDPRVKSYTVLKRAHKSWYKEITDEFVDIKDKSFIDTVIEPETTYYYTVISVDEFAVQSEASIEVQFNTTKEQGKVIAPPAEENPLSEESQKVEVNKAPPANAQTPTVVKPMDDLDMSEI